MSLPVVFQAARRIRAALPDLDVYAGPSPERVEGTGSVVLEVLDGGPWGFTPSGARHRTLQINILSDRTRDEDGLPLADDADERAWALWERLDPLFNDWGQDWRRTEWRAVHHSRRADGPSLIAIPNGDGSVMLSCRYEVSHD